MATDQQQATPGAKLTRELIASDPDRALAEIEQLAQRAGSAEELVAELRTQLDERVQQAAEAERRAAGAGDELVSLRQQLVDGQNQQSSLLTGQSEALAAYRELVLRAEPELPPELITGGTLGDVNASIESARAMVAHVQAALTRSNAAAVVPAGAPLRVLVPDTSQMSAREKLSYGIALSRDGQRADLMSG